MASVNIPAKSLCYVKADGTLALANATSEGKEASLYVATACNAGQMALCFTPGNIIGELSGLTPGQNYFMTTSDGVIGSYPVATGNVVMSIGRAITTTEIVFNLSLPITI
jgi:hypothetical protein